MLNVRDFIHGEVTTQAVQSAIDQAAKEKSPLYFPPGTYPVSALTLRTGSMLYLERDALICAHPDGSEWSTCHHQPVIGGADISDVSIRGAGVIDGAGETYIDENGQRAHTDNRPEYVILLRRCERILIEGVTLKNAVGWTLHLDDCDDALVDGVVIRNPRYEKSCNSDGIDINGCRNVTVMHCDIETGDDAICLKNVDYSGRYWNENRTGFPRKPMYNIHVFDCRTASTCNATKIGTETVGDIHHVRFERIHVCKHSQVLETGAGRPNKEMVHSLTAISIQSNDGAKVHDIVCRDYQVESIYAPVLIEAQRKTRFGDHIKAGYVQGVTIENVFVKESHRNSMILGAQPGQVSDVSISGLYVRNFEKGLPEYDPHIPDGSQYPDPFCFGTFPAYGVYARNTKNLHIAPDCVFIDAGESGRACLDIEE